MVRETIPPCCHIEFCISEESERNCQNCPTSPNFTNAAALARASDYENMLSLFHEFKEGTSKHQGWTQYAKYAAGGMPAEGADSEVRFIY